MTDEERLDKTMSINERLAVAPLVAFGAEDYFIQVLDALIVRLEGLDRRLTALEKLEGQRTNRSMGVSRS